MSKEYIINVARLEGDKTEKLTCQFPAEIMDIEEGDLQFESPISCTASAYLASDHLVIHLDIDAKAKLPCTTCNDPIEKTISLRHVYYSSPIEELDSQEVDLRPIIRENILLETPHFAECVQEGCPEKEALKGYFATASESPSEDSHFPFAQLEREIDTTE